MLLLKIVVQATVRPVETYWHSKISDEVRWRASIFLLISGIAHEPVESISVWRGLFEVNYVLLDK